VAAIIEDRRLMHAPSDIEWLGLERDGAGRWSFRLTGPLSRFDGKFYGGTGIALTTALLELETERPALWATVQFVGSADVGDRIDCHVEVLAQGRRTSQVRMTGSVDGRVMLAAIGATGDPRRGDLNAQLGTMPDVGSPDDASHWRPNVPFAIDFDRPSWLQIAELRDVRIPGRPHALWARLRDHPQTRASLGFLADMVPSAVMQAAGRAGGGSSLDNAMRFGPEPDTDWVLVDFDPYFIASGYAHGAARLWSTDGTLLGVASQTAAMIPFD
jgi:acyl-CoA thioesterase